MSATLAYHVRWMVSKDMPEIVLIDAGSFENPWAKDDFNKVLRQRDHIGMVAENPEGRVVGYMVYKCSRHHIDLIRFAVASDRRRQGVGTSLIAKLTAKLSKIRNRIYIDVPERLLAMQLLLKSCGIPAVSVERGKDGDDDVFCFEYHFTETGDA